MEVDLLLIDGDKFKLYTDENLEPIDHRCIIVHNKHIKVLPLPQS